MYIAGDDSEGSVMAGSPVLKLSYTCIVNEQTALKSLSAGMLARFYWLSLVNFVNDTPTDMSHTFTMLAESLSIIFRLWILCNYPYILYHINKHYGSFGTKLTKLYDFLAAVGAAPGCRMIGIASCYSREKRIKICKQFQELLFDYYLERKIHSLLESRW